VAIDHVSHRLKHKKIIQQQNGECMCKIVKKIVECNSTNFEMGNKKDFEKKNIG